MRSGIDLIAERIESENMVVDLLDYDVRFGQGFLFSPPRPVRAEALQSAAGVADLSKSGGDWPNELVAAGGVPIRRPSFRDGALAPDPGSRCKQTRVSRISGSLALLAPRNDERFP